MALALDGHAIANASSATSLTVNLTTTSTNDVIIVIVGVNGAAGTTSLSDSGGANLTWNARTGSPWTNAGNGHQLFYWWAKAPSALSADPIKVSITNSRNITICAFGISGANTTSPFDTNASLPAETTGTAGTSSVNISTSNADDMLIGLEESSQPGSAADTAVAPYALIDSTTLAPIGSTEYKVVSATQTNLATGFSNTSTTRSFIIVGDAIVQASTGITQTESVTLTNFLSNQWQNSTLTTQGEAVTTLDSYYFLYPMYMSEALTLVDGFSYDLLGSENVITFVGSATGSTGASLIATSFTISRTVATGNWLIVFIAEANAITAVSGVTDSLGNSFRLFTSANGSTITRGELWIAPVTVGGADVITVSFGVTTAFASGVCAEYSGVGFIGTGTSSSVGTDTAISVSQTTQDPNNVIVAGFAQDALLTSGDVYSTAQGSLRAQINTSNITANAASAIVDNGETALVSVENAVNSSVSSEYVALTIELRSAPRLLESLILTDLNQNQSSFTSSSESVLLSDAFVEFDVGFQSLFNETILLNEFMSNQSQPSAFTESISLQDNFYTLYPMYMLETASLADFIAPDRNFSMLETITLSDQWVNDVTLNLMNELVLLSDAVSFGTPFYQTLTESLLVSDTFVEFDISLNLMNESVLLSDFVFVSKYLNVTLSESIILLDNYGSFLLTKTITLVAQLLVYSIGSYDEKLLNGSIYGISSIGGQQEKLLNP